MVADVAVPHWLSKEFRARFGKEASYKVYEEGLRSALQNPEALFSRGDFYVYAPQKPAGAPPEEYVNMKVGGSLGHRLYQLCGIYGAEQDDIFANAMARRLNIDLGRYEEFLPMSMPVKDKKGLEQYVKDLPPEQGYAARIQPRRESPYSGPRVLVWPEGLPGEMKTDADGFQVLEMKMLSSPLRMPGTAVNPAAPIPDAPITQR